MCLPEVQKVSWSTGGKRERGETNGEGGIRRRATFHEGLEHFVKYYVFTKNSCACISEKINFSSHECAFQKRVSFYPTSEASGEIDFISAKGVG